MRLKLNEALIEEIMRHSKNGKMYVELLNMGDDDLMGYLEDLNLGRI